jgi:hypothetical protein
LSNEVEVRVVEKNDHVENAAELARAWRVDDPTATIAVLCRNNIHAIRVCNARSGDKGARASSSSVATSIERQLSSSSGYY